MAAARASWFALPVTKVSNENVGLSRARSRLDGFDRPRRGLRGADRRLRAARQHQAQAELAPARLGGEPFDARGKALAHELEHESVWRCQDQGIGCLAHLGRERPDPGIELLRGELLLKPPQASVPEILHLLVGLDEARFYLLGHALSTDKELTMH
jgi:hypothetical protein